MPEIRRDWLISLIKVEIKTLKDNISSENWLNWALQEVSALGNLPEDFKGPKTNPPDAKTCKIAKNVIYELYKFRMKPDRIFASADESIVISFLGEGKYADIECFYDGAIVAIIDNYEVKEYKIWETDSLPIKLKLTFETIRDFMNFY